jgi:methionyl aminopeptidase
MNLDISGNSASETIKLHSADDFAAMRKAGHLAAATLDFITPHVRVGVTTGTLNDLCEEFIRDHGAIPAPLGYGGFPTATCISLNEIICHGIPSHSRTLTDKDVLNIDITVILDGWFGDSSRMYCAGEFSALPVRSQKLIQTTYDCLMAGIAVVKPGARLGDIGAAIEKLAHAEKFSVVEIFCGHGIGQKFHMPPQVMHYGDAGTGAELKSGMIFTIEPMINMGSKDGKEILAQARNYPNNTIWPYATRDKKLSAQFEHTIGVTDTGYEIFTLSPAGLTLPPYTA